jgi:hypothetical protein
MCAENFREVVEKLRDFDPRTSLYRKLICR